MSTKRLVVIADLHCGHITGLTPPEWDCADKPGRLNQKTHKIRQAIWGWYRRTIESLYPIHCLVCNGDAIDGRGERSGGTELISTDQQDQCRMAVESIQIAKAKTTVMTYGTAYHVSHEGNDYEKQIADTVGAVKIGSHEWIEVNGVVFDCKHHIGTSQVPYGRLTMLGRDETWGSLWADAKLQPRADWVIRSHVHYCVGGFRFSGGHQKWAITTPALQGMGTKFGSRRMSGTVDVGFLVFDVTDKGVVTWQSKIAYLPEQQAQVLKI
jgi:hypothetical protein